MFDQEATVVDEQETMARPAVVTALLRAPAAEQHLLLGWSRELGLIRQRDLSAREKVAAVIRLTRERKAAWPLVKVFGRTLKQVAWDARSWKLRLGVGTIMATFVTVGTASAGLVNLGGGVGLPLWVLTGLGGVLVGLAIDALAKRARKAKAA
jgi:hypothetical protein